MYSIQKAYQEFGRKAKRKIDQEKDELFVGTDLGELVAFYYSMDHFYPIQPVGGHALTASIEKGWNIPDQMLHPDKLFQSSCDFTTETLLIKIPIQSNPSINGLKELFPHPGSEKNIRLRQDCIEITITTKEFEMKHSNVLVAEESYRLQGIVDEWILSTNNQINNLNKHLEDDIRNAIEERINMIQADKRRYEELSKIINLPLTRREDPIKEIRLDPAPIVKRIKPSPKNETEYVLDRSKVADIISVLNNQGLQFEKTPSTYRALGEEDLRNILLINLNTVFEGKAVGEAFSNRGKTDIHLSIDKGNILLMECKIWKGKAAFNDAVSQLLSYLTWRNSFGIMIYFCKVKEMSQIIEKAAGYASTHSTFSGNFLRNSSHFSCMHKLSSDSKKTAELHYVFYNLYSEK